MCDAVYKEMNTFMAHRVPIYSVVSKDVKLKNARIRPFLKWPGVWCEMSNNEAVKIEV